MIGQEFCIYDRGRSVDSQISVWSPAGWISCKQVSSPPAMLHHRVPTQTVSRSSLCCCILHRIVFPLMKIPAYLLPGCPDWSAERVDLIHCEQMVHLLLVDIIVFRIIQFCVAIRISYVFAQWCNYYYYCALRHYLDVHSTTRAKLWLLKYLHCLHKNKQLNLSTHKLVSLNFTQNAGVDSLFKCWCWIYYFI